MVSRASCSSLGLVADRLLGEPPEALHPVVWFGRTMRGVENRLYADRRERGVVHALAGVGLGVAAGGALRQTTLATWLAVAGRDLGRVAIAVAGALEAEDLDRARRLLPSLVGRDPESLDEKELARAVVESVAENTVDAIVAPALWGAVGGAPGALGYRAVNTLDAMVGHRDQRYENYGWASARLDDMAGWFPARVTAALVVAVRPGQAAEVWRAVRNQAPAHPSPNSGVAEAAFAAALDLRLGGQNRYGNRVEYRPPLGFGRSPEVRDIARAVALSRHVTLALSAALATVGLLVRPPGPGRKVRR